MRPCAHFAYIFTVLYKNKYFRMETFRHIHVWLKHITVEGTSTIRLEHWLYSLYDFKLVVMSTDALSKLVNKLNLEQHKHVHAKEMYWYARTTAMRWPWCHFQFKIVDNCPQGLPRLVKYLFILFIPFSPKAWHKPILQK